MITYNAIIYSTNKRLDRLPVSLKVGAPIASGSRFRSVRELCNNATEKEIRWYNECVLPCIVDIKDDK